MSLLGPNDREIVRQQFGLITDPVRLLLFSQSFNEPDTARISKQIVAELAELSDLVTFEEVNFVLDKDRAAAFGIDAIPAIVVLRGETDTRIRFLGAPSGYEFMSLIEAIVAAGSGARGLTPENSALVAAVARPLDIKVFVTPTCPHCPRAVTIAHKMALANPLITATCIEATEFLDLSRRFRVNGVPKTVVNDSVEIMGALPEEAYVKAVLQLPEPEPSSPPPS